MHEVPSDYFPIFLSKGNTPCVVLQWLKSDYSPFLRVYQCLLRFFSGFFFPEGTLDIGDQSHTFVSVFETFLASTEWKRLVTSIDWKLLISKDFWFNMVKKAVTLGLLLSIPSHIFLWLGIILTLISLIIIIKITFLPYYTEFRRWEKFIQYMESSH